MALTLGEMRDDVLDRLGDTVETPLASRVWTEDEIVAYILEGYRDFCKRAQLLWDMAHINDLPYTGNYTNKSDLLFFEPGMAVHNMMCFTNTAERDFQGRGISPANHTSVVEREDFLVSPLISAVEKLPDQLDQTDRVTYDGRKIEPLQSRKMQHRDNWFEIVRGQVYGYLQDKDGLRSLRKWKVPATEATHYKINGNFGVPRGSREDIVASTTTLRMHIDQWGAVFSGAVDFLLSIFWDFAPPIQQVTTQGPLEALNALTEFENDVIAGTFGGLKRLPGYFPANGPWGLVKRITRDANNTRVEFFRQPRAITEMSSTFEIPDIYLKSVRHYAMSKAYARRGVGQDLQLRDHYKDRYEVGVLRAKARVHTVGSVKMTRMGGSGNGLPRRRFSNLPRNI